MTGDDMQAVRSGLLALASVLLLACSYSPPDLYVLSPIADSGTSANGAPTMAVVRVHIADYLDRREIITRQGSNELQLSDDNRWGEPLREGVPRVLAEDLTRSLRDARAVLPREGRGKDLPFEYLVTLDSFEANGDRVITKGRWQLRDMRDGKIVADGIIDRQRNVTAGDYPAIVAGLNHNLNETGQEIAEATAPLIHH